VAAAPRAIAFAREGEGAVTIRLAREAHALPRAVEPDVEIFAVGDIHGRADLLDALLGEASREPRKATRRVLVFLGDLIDRGPENLLAIDLARHAGERIGAGETIGLMGNHEAMMRLALDSSTPLRDALDALATWAANGGDHVIAEFLDAERAPANLGELLREARDALPPEIGRWLESLAPHARSGEMLFVHAGVNPRFPLDRFLAQPWNTPLSRLDEDSHWAWVRRPFLEHRPGPRGWDGHFIVHGHTPNDGPGRAPHAEQVRRLRLNLDGGSAMTGVAKMAILRGAFAEVLTAVHSAR
jgi:serine/threonine protein phosphatase 1